MNGLQTDIEAIEKYCPYDLPEKCHGGACMAWKWVEFRSVVTDVMRQTSALTASNTERVPHKGYCTRLRHEHE